MGYTVRVLPRHRLLAGPAELGLVRGWPVRQSRGGRRTPDAHM